MLRATSLLALILALGAVAGCGGAPRPVAPAPPAGTVSAPPGTGALIAADALRYLGTPYRRGGMDGDGMDCSGLVGRVYLDRGYPLPRTAEEIARAGIPVEREDLAPGDIVVFATAAEKPSHVGIYVGPAAFVHAPGKGDRVRVGDLESEYFRARFRGGRRLLRE